MPTTCPLLLLLLLGLLALLPASMAISTVMVTVTAAPAPASTSYTDDAAFQNDMLNAHNFYRTEQGVKNVTWNATSAKTAANYSLACIFEHSVCPGAILFFLQKKSG